MVVFTWIFRSLVHFVFDLTIFRIIFVFASILTSCRLILFVLLRYLTFSRTKLRFCFDLDQLKANIVRFASLQKDYRRPRESL
jgi:hypothetical protein